MKIYSIPFGADFLEELKQFILHEGAPLEELAVVFAGKRPSLYLKRKFAEHCRKPFYSPCFFSIEEFIDRISRIKYGDFIDLQYTDAIWALYNTIQSLPVFNNHPFKKKGFGEFFHWGRYILNFIDQLDAENISNDKLRSLEGNARIGYDVPESVNELLMNLSIVRNGFHETLKSRKRFTKGYKYLCALEAVDGIECEEFKKIYFAGLFALVGIEREIIKKIWLKGKGEIIVEGNPDDWQVLKDLAVYYGAEYEMIPCDISKPDRISIHSGFDTHSEVLKVYEILKKIDSKKTAIVLPISEPLFPLLTFAVDRLDGEYNISLGYPFSRTSVFDLMAAILDAQLKQREDHRYPARYYLEVILHPFVKNLDNGVDIRSLLLGIERTITGEAFRSDLANKPFITLDEAEAACGSQDAGLEVEKEIKYEICNAETLISHEAGKSAIERIHWIFFRNLEHVKDLSELAQKLEEALSFILDYTPIRSYVLSGEIFKQAFETLEGLKETEFSKERFHPDDAKNKKALCDFILYHLKGVTLPFETKPIEPLEILGVLETRNIHFDSVIMLDMNEGIIPQPKKIDPLVPIGVYEQIGIPSPDYNEEIFRYNFYRLISSARDVHLIYIDSEDKQRSRYIEQLIWNEEKTKRSLNAITIDKSIYKINLKLQDALPEIQKTENVIRLLMMKTYSSTAIDDYIRCPVLFYYGHILNFEQKRGLSEDIDVMDRGNIIHHILSDTFKNFREKEIASHLYNEILSRMNKAIEENFKDRVVTGDFYLFKKLTEYKLDTFLRKNVKNAVKPFTILHLEKIISNSVDIGRYNINFKGRLDRVDYIPEDNEYMIIDYKTGGTKQYSNNALTNIDPNSIDDVHNTIKSFQLPLYLLLFSTTFSIPANNVNAKLILLKNNEEEKLFESNPIEERKSILEMYIDCIRTVMGDILDGSKPFRPFDDNSCGTCLFTCICHM